MIFVARLRFGMWWNVFGNVALVLSLWQRDYAASYDKVVEHTLYIKHTDQVINRTELRLLWYSNRSIKKMRSLSIARVRVSLLATDSTVPLARVVQKAFINPLFDNQPLMAIISSCHHNQRHYYPINSQEDGQFS